jgi:hypothetical protein
MSHGTCIYVFTYINSISNSIMLQLYLQHKYCNVIFKMKLKVYIASGSAPPSPNYKLWMRTCNGGGLVSFMLVLGKTGSIKWSAAERTWTCWMKGDTSPLCSDGYMKQAYSRNDRFKVRILITCAFVYI